MQVKHKQEHKRQGADKPCRNHIDGKAQRSCFFQEFRQGLPHGRRNKNPEQPERPCKDKQGGAQDKQQQHGRRSIIRRHFCGRDGVVELPAQNARLDHAEQEIECNTALDAGFYGHAPLIRRRRRIGFRRRYGLAPYKNRLSIEEKANQADNKDRLYHKTGHGNQPLTQMLFLCAQNENGQQTGDFYKQDRKGNPEEVIPRLPDKCIAPARGLCKIKTCHLRLSGLCVDCIIIDRHKKYAMHNFPGFNGPAPEQIIRTALAEDMGQGGDITSHAVIDEDARAQGVFRARESGVLAGMPLAAQTFNLVDPHFSFDIRVQDGGRLAAGDIIARVEGPARALVTAERTALNFLTHLSGIATLTHHYVQAVEGTHAGITDTRKTLAGLRTLQKYAVRMGGGRNHRFRLDDAILIKDNHIAMAGGIDTALTRAWEKAGHTVKIEIEVDTLEQLEQVLTHGGADIVMLDNFDIADLKTAVSMVDGRLITEASGGVNLETVRSIAETGVDYISVGALTHSAPALDIGLDSV